MQTPQQQLGAAGEAAAARYLSGLGWQLLDANWRCRAGELDLVGRDPAGQLAAIEVKTRSTTRYGTGFDAITPAKHQRLHRLLISWAKAHGIYCPVLRVDVIEAYPDGHGGFHCILHERVES